MNIVDPFLATLHAYKNAVFEKDLDAFLALYEPDIHVFDMWSTWSLHGIVAWRDMASAWFNSLGDERVVVELDDVDSSAAGDLIVGHAILTYTAITTTGAKLRSLSSRATMSLRKNGDRWRVFHEHTSAPIDHESIKAILHQDEETSCGDATT